MHQKQGFTLIELLIVISIVTLLIAILLPALSNARDAAKTVRCLSNERQIGIATNMYMNDYDEYVTPMKSKTRKYWNGSIAGRLWHELLAKVGPYSPNDYGLIYRWSPSLGIYDRSSFLCPSEERDFVYHHYGLNRWAGGDSDNPNAYPFHRLSELNRPTSDILHILDGNIPASPRADYTNFTAFRHRESTNALYVDGHCASISEKNIQNADYKYGTTH